MKVYGLRDVVADEIVGVFLAKNDLVACRMNLKCPDNINPDDFEIVYICDLLDSLQYPVVSRLSRVAEKYDILANKSSED